MYNCAIYGVNANSKQFRFHIGKYRRQKQNRKNQNHFHFYYISLSRLAVYRPMKCVFVYFYLLSYCVLVTLTHLRQCVDNISLSSFSDGDGDGKRTFAFCVRIYAWLKFIIIDQPHSAQFNELSKFCWGCSKLIEEQLRKQRERESFSFSPTNWLRQRIGSRHMFTVSAIVIVFVHSL